MLLMLGWVSLVTKFIIKMRMVRQVYVQKIEEVQIGKNPELLNIFKLHKKNRQLKLTIITNIQ